MDEERSCPCWLDTAPFLLISPQCSRAVSIGLHVPSGRFHPLCLCLSPLPVRVVYAGCACTYGGHRKVSGVLFYRPPPFPLETSSGAHQIFWVRLASQQTPEALLLPPLAALDLWESKAILCSYLVAGDPNSGSRA